MADTAQTHHGAVRQNKRLEDYALSLPPAELVECLTEVLSTRNYFKVEMERVIEEINKTRRRDSCLRGGDR